MQEAKTIRALERGLQVLHALQENPISSLHDIYLATRIPKPTLLRILHTLDRAGLVSRRVADGQYRLRAIPGTARKPDRHDRVAEAPAPVLVRLCQKVKWQCDLHVPAGDHMERRESTRAFSPSAAKKLGGVSLPVVFCAPWLVAAVGRAYLAWCSEREREQILRRLRKSDKLVDRLARDPKRLDNVLDEVRRRGYATRDPAFVGGAYGSVAYDDGWSAIAVALSDRTRVHGSINLLWIKTAFRVEQFAARHLADLQDAAREIVSALQRPTK